MGLGDKKDDVLPDGGDSPEGDEPDNGPDTHEPKPTEEPTPDPNKEEDDQGIFYSIGEGIRSRTRGLLGNETPDTATERTDRERHSSRVVSGMKNNRNPVDDPDPNVHSLQSNASKHTETAAQANEAVREVVREENEGLSQTAEALQEEIEAFEDYGEQDVSEELHWEYNPHRDVDTPEEDPDNLFSYMADRSDTLEDVFDKIAGVDDNMGAMLSEKEELKEEKEEKEEISLDEEERISHEKRFEMTPSEAEEADIDEIPSFADDVAGSTESAYQNEVQELETKIAELDVKIRKAEGMESALYDRRNELVDEIEEVYEPHAEAMEEAVHAISSELEEGIEYLEGLAAMELPNLTEEHGTKYVDDAASVLQSSREDAADAIADRVVELSGYLADVEKEHQELVDVLPEQYVEDEQFGRIDIADNVLSGVADEIAEGYESVPDRISTAYEEATGEDFYQAFDDADGALDHLRASYADEVAE